MWRREARLAAALAMLALPAFVAAEGNVTAASLRPTGPVTIRADKAEWEKGSAMMYTGNVHLESGDLNLVGDQLELRQFEKGEFTAKVTGAPAKLDHTGLRDDQGKQGPPVHAEAKTLTYDSRTDIVEVVGAAVLNRGDDHMTGENIHYDVAQRRIQAEGGTNGQVIFTLQPPPQRDGAAAPGKPGVTPAPAAPPKPGVAPTPAAPTSAPTPPKSGTP
jgi:lipopolysaccharide transport protein LptA